MTATPDRWVVRWPAQPGGPENPGGVPHSPPVNLPRGPEFGPGVVGPRLPLGPRPPGSVPRVDPPSLKPMAEPPRPVYYQPPIAGGFPTAPGPAGERRGLGGGGGGGGRASLAIARTEGGSSSGFSWAFLIVAAGVAFMVMRGAR